MRSTTARRRARRVPPMRDLPAAHLLEIFGGVADADPDHEGLLFFLGDVGDGEHCDIAYKELHGVHPTSALLGFVAPADWHALGVAVHGNATRLDDPDQPPARASTTLVVTRTGDMASRTQLAGDDGETLEGAMEGLVPDACLRVFGLPTPPPATGTDAMWTTLWVDRAFQSWIDPEHRHWLTSWENIERLHPARAEIDGGDLVGAAIAHARRWHWQRVLDAPTLFGLGNHLTPDAMHWFDAGSLSRFLPTIYPPVDELLADLLPVLEPSLSRRLGETVTALRAIEDQ